jgi:predicted dehydrogenase
VTLSESPRRRGRLNVSSASRRGSTARQACSPATETTDHRTVGKGELGVMSSIGLAVIGAGYWGPNLVRTAMATPALQLAWLCDLDEERARAVLGRYTTVKATASYERVLADPAVAAVAIATPAATHFDLVRAALEAGKHVLIEKPLTSSVSEAVKLAGLAERSGLVLMCDHTYCYTPAVRRIRELIRGGEIGEVQFVDSVRINLGLVQPDVDVLWDLAPHDLSILDFVLPDDVTPVAVAAHTGDPIGNGHACLGYLSVWLSTGALAHVHVNWLSPTKIRTSIFGGSRRTIVWDDMNPAARLMLHDRGVDWIPGNAMRPDDRRQALISYRVGDIQVPALPEREALMSVLSEFASAIAEHRQPLTDARAGIRVLELLEAATRSADNGGIKVPVNMETGK